MPPLGTLLAVEDDVVEGALVEDDVVEDDVVDDAFFFALARAATPWTALGLLLVLALTGMPMAWSFLAVAGA